MSAEEKPAVTETELDLELLEGRQRFLRVPLRDPDGGLAFERFPVRGQLSVSGMIRLARAETAINQALIADDDERLVEEMAVAQAEVTRIIRELTPGAAEPELDTQQMLVTLAWLAGDESVADMIAKTLSAGQTGAKTDAALNEAASKLDDAAGAGAEGGAPLPSSEPSPTLFSGSDADDAGGPAGGTSREERRTASPGESSGLISSTSSVT